jgi:hypothetical protein
MAAARCHSERLRLKNEISFARSGAMWGGPSAQGTIDALKRAIEAIDRRLRELTDENQSHCVNQ